MNFAIVRYIISFLLQFEAAFLLLPALVGGLYGEVKSVLVFLSSALLCFVCGFLLRCRRPRNYTLYLREGFVTVALGWFVLSLFGAVPFVLSGDIPHYIDALFETISGFTTTGATILSDVESLSRAGLFWRSFTHWIGGMGVFVFIMSIMPLMGGSTINLMRAESTGPSVGRLVPRVKDTARILYTLYIIFTIAGTVILCLCGLSLFDSLTTTFGSVGTGGFGVRNDSMASYSPVVQYVVTLLMILSGVNYTFYFCLIRKQLKDAFSMEEVKCYFLIIAGSVGVIIWNIRSLYPTFEETFRHAFFQVGTLITSTGYATTDYDTWPQLSKTILILVMFIGSCAGSTGGGIKVSRILILMKGIKKELQMMIHPKMVKKIRMDGHVISHETIRSTNAFIAVYFLMFFVSLLLIGMDNYDFTTNFTGVLATFNNMGPGFGLVGPTCNFSIFSSFSKCVLMFDMLAGRLELFPLLIIMLPSCWKKY